MYAFTSSCVRLFVRLLELQKQSTANSAGPWHHGTNSEENVKYTVHQGWQIHNHNTSRLWWPNQIKASRRGCSRTCKLASRLAMVAAGTRPPRCSRRRSSAPWWASLCSDGEAPRPTENAGLETMWTRHAVDPQHRDELASAPMAKRQDRQKTRGWRRCGLGKRATGGGLGASGQFGGKVNRLEPGRE